MKITGWKLVIFWEDETTEDVVDAPYWLHTKIDKYLDELEEEYV
mgnify:FL=1|tara:strand:+ start:1066 stop:1197 length:132 start_codon:yes stop_codon:yes gene_type:complete